MKILLSLPEFPFAHHGGAARSMRTIAEMMVKAGHQVHCVATTATERECNIGACLPSNWKLSMSLAGMPFIRCGEYRGVEYVLVETGGRIRDWRTPEHESSFFWHFNHALTAFKPDIVLGYGAYPTDAIRFDRAKRHGAKLVLGLRNYGYTQRDFFPRFDGVLTCSQYLTDWYRSKVKIESTPLPLPVWPEDVVAGNRSNYWITAINPARRKGSMILETVFRILHKTRPDIPLLIVGESSEPEMLRLMDYADTMPWVGLPRTIYSCTKVLLVPSVWEEPAGRVIVEAMMNGIPPIITDRGGMPEVANGGAYILPLDKRVTVDTKEPVSLEVAQPWIDLITGLYDNPPNRENQHPYEWASARARDASRMYLPENLTPIYEDYFQRILQGKPFESQRVPVKSLAGLLSQPQGQQPVTRF
jgi:glycosyltransferase involved in cell wall biosynthesis